MKKFLEKSEGTEKATDQSSQKDSCSQKKACHIEAELKFHGAADCLKCSDRTGQRGCRAGIAVKARGTEVLPWAFVNAACLKIFDMNVCKAEGCDLNQLSLEGVDRFHMYYPSPMHSIQMLTALFHTTAASFRQIPRIRKNMAERISRICRCVFLRSDIFGCALLCIGFFFRKFFGIFCQSLFIFFHIISHDSIAQKVSLAVHKYRGGNGSYIHK